MRGTMFLPQIFIYERLPITPEMCTFSFQVIVGDSKVIIGSLHSFVTLY